MRSCVEVVAALLIATASAQASPSTAEQVQTAASAVATDPKLSDAGKTERVLRFKRDDDAKKSPRKAGSSSLGRFGRWLSEVTRALAWVLACTGAVVALVLWRRWFQVRADAAPRGALALPTHVRELDIRPDSLPDDIGGAARALWLAGDARGALSLLYRGTLSKLVHAHAVPVSAASTEGDCVRLARASMPGDAADFVARLVGVWQRAVYGGQTPAAVDVMALCDAFDAKLAVSAQRNPAASPA